MNRGRGGSGIAGPAVVCPTNPVSAVKYVVFGIDSDPGTVKNMRGENGGPGSLSATSLMPGVIR